MKRPTTARKKYVTVPSPIEPRDLEGRPFRETDPRDETKQELRDVPPVSLHRYLMQFAINEGDPGSRGAKIGVGHDGNKRINRLDRLFATAEPGAVVAVDFDDWLRVKKIIEETVWTPPRFGACMEPLEEAWMGARDAESVDAA